MALSNWATLAFDHHGRPCSGSFLGYCGMTADIYKNWVYLRLPRSGFQNKRYVQDTIGEISHGSLELGSMHIEASRTNYRVCRQEGVYIFASSSRIVGKETEYQLFGGIGVSGFRDLLFDALEHLGIPETEWDRWDCMQASTADTRTFELFRTDMPFDDVLDRRDDPDIWRSFTIGPDDPDELRQRFETDWVGVLPKTFEMFLDWIEGLPEHFTRGEVVRWLETVRRGKPIFYNQGDEYLATRMDIDLPTGEVGQKAPAPLMLQMLKEDDDSL